MKTTLDLPADLIEQLKLRARHGGRRLKDIAAEVIAAGLAASEESEGKLLNKSVADDEKVSSSPLPLKGHIRLPFFECSEDAPARFMTKEQHVALIYQAQMEDDIERYGKSI